MSLSTPVLTSSGVLHAADCHDFPERAQAGLFARIVRNVSAFTAQPARARDGQPSVRWLTGLKETIDQLPDLVRSPARSRLGSSSSTAGFHRPRRTGWRGLSLHCSSIWRGAETAPNAAALATSSDILTPRAPPSPAPASSGAAMTSPGRFVRRPWTLMYFTAHGRAIPVASSPFRCTRLRFHLGRPTQETLRRSERRARPGLPRSVAQPSAAGDLHQLRPAVEPRAPVAATLSTVRRADGVTLVIPTLDEEEAIAGVIAEVPVGIRGGDHRCRPSRDATRARARAARSEAGPRGGAHLAVPWPRRSRHRAPRYRLGVHRWRRQRPRRDLLPRLLAPHPGRHARTSMIASRTLGRREPGSTQLAPDPVRRLAGGTAPVSQSGVAYTEMCAFRAIRREALAASAMREMGAMAGTSRRQMKAGAFRPAHP